MIPTSLKNKIRETYSNDKNLELELRFGKFERYFVPGVTRQVFNRVNSYFSEKAPLISSTITDYIMGKVRKSIDEKGNTTWITKERIWNEDVENYNIRYSMSRETNVIPIKDEHFHPETMREKKRSSYLVFGNDVRIDITLVNMFDKKKKKDEITYEVEIELLNPEKLDSFEKAILVTLKLVLDTIILYTENEKIKVINEVNSILGSTTRGKLDHYPLVQARNLKIRDMVYGGLIANKDTGYSVTHKADGQRKMLYFTKSGIWILSPPYSVMKISETEIPILSGTILDGELIPLEKRLSGSPKAKIWYLTFDTLARDSNNSIQNLSHRERLSHAQSVSSNLKGDLIQVDTKTFRYFEYPEDFFRVMREMFKEQLLLPYKQDGYMFTPQNSKYNPHSDIHPIYKRILTDYPDICKYKRKEDLTIDFAIRWQIGGKIELYTANDIPFPEKYEVDSSSLLTQGLPNNTIVEYGYDFERKMLFPHRIRHDKVFPNKLDVAKDVWADINDPIEADMLQGDTFTLLRKYHNRIKKDLFLDSLKGDVKESGKSPRLLLDIGSGYGGDLAKWKAFDKIVAVEPDEEHVAELKRRIVTYKMEEKVRIVVAGGQETEKIREAVEDFMGKGARVDVVSSMLSLTFFWQSSQLVNSLVNTIVTNIKPNGKYIFLTMDGDLVEQTFEPALGVETGTGSILNKLVLGPATLEYNGNVKPKELNINIKGTIVENQREWLVRLDDLKIRLGKYGFEMTSIDKADKERFLTPEEIIMTKMYTYGIFTGKGFSLPEDIPSPIASPISIPSPNIISLDHLKESLLPPLPISNFPPLKRQEELPPLKRQEELPPLKSQEELPPLKRQELPPVPEKLSPLKTRGLPPLPIGNLPPLFSRKKEKEKEKEEELGMLPMNKVEKIQVTWWNENIVRIGSLGSGSCAVHSILTGYLRSYQINSDVKYRKKLAKDLRRDLAKRLREPDPIFKDKTIYETAGNGIFLEMYREQLAGVKFEKVFDQKVDFSINGLEKLFDSNQNLGDEFYSYAAESLGIDIYVMRLTNKDLYVHLNTRTPGIEKRAVIISGNNLHFETIGIERNGLYQTFFEPNDPFLLKIQTFSIK